mmetsp:Transcript_9653/g.20848  ORF Transcript_9653/g.20848 Transcript_9653/m.20848 type:complete len:215 (-) Transcript_9653:167-811(-)
MCFHRERHHRRVDHPPTTPRRDHGRILRRGAAAPPPGRFSFLRTRRTHPPRPPSLPPPHRPQHVSRRLRPGTPPHQLRRRQPQPRMDHRPTRLRRPHPVPFSRSPLRPLGHGSNRSRFLLGRSRRRGIAVRLLLGGGAHSHLVEGRSRRNERGEDPTPSRIFRFVLSETKSRRAEGDRISPPRQRGDRHGAYERGDESGFESVRLFGADVGNAV